MPRTAGLEGDMYTVGKIYILLNAECIMATGSLWIIDNSEIWYHYPLLQQRKEIDLLTVSPDRDCYLFRRVSKISFQLDPSPWLYQIVIQSTLHLAWAVYQFNAHGPVGQTADDNSVSKINKIIK